MKVKKGSLFFLFLCLMGVLTVSAPISPLHHDSIGVVYAETDTEEDTDTDTEEDTPAPAAGSNGNYENLQVPSILATAYADGLRMAETDTSTDREASKAFRDNIERLIKNPDSISQGKYQFDTVGVFMGPIGQSSGSGANDVATTAGMGIIQLRTDFSFDHDIGEAYWTFGRAVQNLRTDASKVNAGTINTSSAMDAISGISTQVANIGIGLLRDWSPALVVLAFTDSDILHKPENQSNQLIKMVNEHELAGNIVGFFGKPVPGIPQLSYSQLITLMIIMLGLVLSILTIFIGEKAFPRTVKKTFVKVMVMIIAVPLTMQVYDWGLKALHEVAGDETQTPEYQLARKHLLLGQWAETGFKLPEGHTLTVRDGRFVLSRDDIRAINGMLVGADADDHQKVADEITRQVAADNNVTNISWQSVVYEDSGSPWRTDQIVSIANELGNGQPIKEQLSEVSDNSIGYLYASGLRSSRNANGDFTYTQNGEHAYKKPYTRFGISPIATYNLLNTSFNSNALSVKSNLSTGSTLPSVAPAAYAYSIGGAGVAEPDKKMKGPVKWLVEITLMIASIKALAKILTTGFGGMLSGGARSMFGSSAGWGELIGAVFAAIFGVIGLSLFSLLALQITHILYGSLHTMIDALVEGSGLGSLGDTLAEFLKPTGWLAKVPFLSALTDAIAELIANGIKSLVTGVMSFILGFLLLPNFVKVPIEAFTAWVSGLPNTLAQKAQAIENEFTGSHRTQGGAAGNIAGAMAGAGEGMLNSGKAAAAGAGMMAGAAISALGGKKDGDKDGDDTKKETDSVAPPEDEKTDENGNPITESVSDNEEPSADEDNQEADENNQEADKNNQEGDAVEGDNKSDENVTTDDDSTEGDAVEGDNKSDENVTTDDDSTEGDVVGGNNESDETITTDDDSTEGDVVGGNNESDETVTTDDNAVEGDVVGGNNESDETVTTDDNAVEGDVNTEDSTMNDENKVQGDINDDRSAIEGNANAEESSVNDENKVQGDINDDRSTVEGDTAGGNKHADGDSVNSNDSSVEGGTNTSNSSAAGGSNTSNSSVAGGTSSSDSSAEGDAVGGDVNASNTTTGDDVNTNESATGDDVSTSDSAVGDTTSPTDSTVGGDTNTTGDVNTSDSTVGSEGSGQGPDVSGGSADNDTTITNDAPTEGTQVSNDTTTADANVTQESSANINQSTDDRTMQQEGNADNRQSADINSNSQTTNDNQSTAVGDTTSTGTQGTGKQGTGKQGTGKQGTGKQGSATSTGKQGTGKQGTGKQGTGKQGTGKQGTGKQGTGKQGTATINSQGTVTSSKQDAGKQGTPQGGKQGTPQGGKQGTPQGGKQGTPQGGKQGTAKIDSQGTVTSSKQGTQSKGGNESTSAKAGRLGRMVKGTKQGIKSAATSAIKQGEVSNAEKAAMGAIHMIGGLTGTQDITQKGVDNIKGREGKNAKNDKNNADQNASNNPQNEHHQQIIDRQRREQEERDERRNNKKPSFIQNVRNKNK